MTMMGRNPWLCSVLFLLTSWIVVACGGSPEPASPTDILGEIDAVEADVGEGVTPIDSLDEDADSTPPPPDVPDPIEPCDALECPEGALCLAVDDTTVGCFVEAQWVETFDTADHMAPSTTAAWGNGTLEAGGGGFGGDGSDGAFEPTEDTTIDTTLNGHFQYTSMVVPEGVTVTVLGGQPWEVQVQGDVSINGWIRSDGQPGHHVCKKPDQTGGAEGGTALQGGIGGAGGGAGGSGGAGCQTDGDPGEGQGGGAPSLYALTSGNSMSGAGGSGGGSFGSKGGDGTAMTKGQPGSAGAVYGAPELTSLLGGSGGGGGAGRDVGGNDGTCGPECSENNVNCFQGLCEGSSTSKGDGSLNSWDKPGASGGGGAGGIGIEASGFIEILGGVSVQGGNGGWGSYSGAGGGGSGGSIRLIAWEEVLLVGGTLSARGGKGGLITCNNQQQKKKAGDGGDGRIRIASVSGLVQGYLVDPAPVPSFGMLATGANSGSGKDGAFAPTQDIVLNTDEGPFEYTSFLLPEDITLTTVGSSPLVIHAQEQIEIYGLIRLNGHKGEIGYSACCGNPYVAAHAGAGGAPASGGFAGGTGGESADGMPGDGPGGAPGGPIGMFSSAGGGGFALEGQAGGTNACNKAGPSGGPLYSDESLPELQGGSGGGGAGDGRAAACTWCEDGQCLVAGNPSSNCPSKATCGGYCDQVINACAGVEGCWSTTKWNPGSGGGGGGGAVHLETPGLVRVDGRIELNGGDGGDSLGASKFDDGTCGSDCTGGCFEGICWKANDGTCSPDCSSSAGCYEGVCYTSTGSFGGSGGGGSGGALRIRAAGLRADGTLEAMGGETGTLNQSGGCAVDPNDENPLPGQGRGGRGSVGRFRIETLSATGSVLIGDGSFSRGAIDPSFGTYAESLWVALESDDCVLTAIETIGGSPLDIVNVQVAPADVDGQVDESNASGWAVDPATLPVAAFVRFRMHLAEPSDSNPGSVVDDVIIHYRYPVE